MREGIKNTRMCQQVHLPGAEIVKALHGGKANVQSKSYSS